MDGPSEREFEMLREQVQAQQSRQEAQGTLLGELRRDINVLAARVEIYIDSVKNARGVVGALIVLVVGSAAGIYLWGRP